MESGILNAVGIWFYSQETHRFLYLLRSGVKHQHHWGLAGGKVEPKETLLLAIARECQEELGYMPHCTHLVPIEKFINGNFCFHTFFACVEKEFSPKLNHEHIGYAWIESGVWPKPMHPGLWNTVSFDVVQHKLEIIMSQLDITTGQSQFQ